MDFIIWEKTILAWVDSLVTTTPIQSVYQINDSVLTDIIKKLKFDIGTNPVGWLKNIFPNILDWNFLNTSCDYLYAVTLLLIYISFSSSNEFEESKNLMCTQLDNSTQVNIVKFLKKIQELDDPFAVTLDKIKHIVSNYVENDFVESPITENIKTPMNNNVSDNSFDSPLQGFFETPKRNRVGNHLKCTSNKSRGRNYLKLFKNLSYQLIEEESERVYLQGKLNILTQNCNEYENKLKNKIEELNLIKKDWDADSKLNETELKNLRKNKEKLLENEKNLKDELFYLEKYISNLESELSNSVAERSKLEFQLKTTQENLEASTFQLNELKELNVKLRNILETKEKEMVLLKNERVDVHEEEENINISFRNDLFDLSFSESENMSVFTEKLLFEKTEENRLMKETIEKLKIENRNLSLENKLIDVEKYEKELKQLKIELKLLKNKESNKNKAKEFKLNSELQKTRRLKEHINELGMKLWRVEENLLQQQNSNRNLLRKYKELKIKYENLLLIQKF